MKYFAAEILILLDIIFLITASSDTAFEEDFVHSFLIKSDKLRKSERLKTAGEEFLEKTAYKVIFLQILVWLGKTIPSLSQVFFPVLRCSIILTLFEKRGGIFHYVIKIFCENSLSFESRY